MFSKHLTGSVFEILHRSVLFSVTVLAARTVEGGLKNAGSEKRVGGVIRVRTYFPYTVLILLVLLLSIHHILHYLGQYKNPKCLDLHINYNGIQVDFVIKCVL